MGRYWGDLNTRARGMSSALPRRADLIDLAHALDVYDLSRRMEKSGFPVQGAREPTGVDLSIRRFAAGMVAVFARWAFDRERQLDFLFRNEDLRSVRALLRGAERSVQPDARMVGLIPTPMLPERLLADLSRMSSAAQVARHLTVVGDPWGPVLMGVLEKGGSLLDAEVALTRSHFSEVTRSTRRRQGGRYLREFAALLIDIENVATVLGTDSNGDRADHLIETGGSITREVFESATSSDSKAAAVDVLMAGSPDVVARALRGSGGQPHEFLREAMAALIDHASRERHLDPCSAAPVVEFLLRLRASVIDLRAILWALSLGVPANKLTFVTP